MRITVNYGWKSFGNGTTPQNYTALVRAIEERVRVSFSFDRTVKGKGGFTENNSRVNSALLSIPREHAKAIAEAILQSLGSEEGSAITLQFGAEDAPDEE